MSWLRKDTTEGGLSKLPDTIENITLTEPEISVIKNNGAEIVVPTTSGNLALIEDVATATGNIDLTGYATLTGEQTLTNKTLDSTCKLSSSMTSAAGGTINFPNPATGDSMSLTTKNGAQTLGNKTLGTSCKLSTSIKSSSDGTINIPNPASGESTTLATTDGTETLSNKTIDSTCKFPQVFSAEEGTTLTFPHISGNHTLMTVAFSQNCKNKYIDSSNKLGTSIKSNSNGTINIPNPASGASTTLATTDGTETLTNKTLAEPEIATIKNNGASIVVPETSGNMALTSDIPSLSGYATENWVIGQGYLTSHQNLSNYATKDGTETLTNKTLTNPTIASFSNGAFTITAPSQTGTIALTSDIPSLSGYATESWVENKGYINSYSTQTIQNKSIDSTNVFSSNSIKSSSGGTHRFINVPSGSTEYIASTTTKYTTVSGTLSGYVYYSEIKTHNNSVIVGHFDVKNTAALESGVRYTLTTLTKIPAYAPVFFPCVRVSTSSPAGSSNSFNVGIDSSGIMRLNSSSSTTLSSSLDYHFYGTFYYLAA